MRLKTIKLAGFKSFVDPTSFHLPSNLLAVVGPNGCGKSNIIDAVRWVMGESSARLLRGELMSDVIFNGSSTRKPVGTATVELIFDNDDGLITGEYAGFSEISIKRQVSRDGVSQYFLNGGRCRRRDIVDLFLGTGLGRRSYSIIEQGMISQIVDARPEDLRAHLEEAAGISKYKERRRETEHRIRHTRDNLERLDDVRAEVDKQLQHLNRQAKQAERYKKLKSRFRRKEAELKALKWRALRDASEDARRNLATVDNRLEARIADRRQVEAEIEAGRERQQAAAERVNQVQGELYEVGGQIARIEQAIQHRQDLIDRQRHELEDTEKSWQQLNEHLDLDRVQAEDLERAIAELEPALERARADESQALEAARAAEAELQSWQQEWQEFREASGEHERAAEVERTRIDHLDRQMLDRVARLEGLSEERSAISGQAIEAEIEELESERDRRQGLIHEFESAIQSLRTQIGDRARQNRELEGELATTREAYQQARGRLSSLEALQQAALGKDQATVTEWLTAHGLQSAPRLAEVLEVEPGWERAVETALGAYLEAVLSESPERLLKSAAALEQGDLLLAETAGANSSQPREKLAAKVTGPGALESLLAGVFAVEDLDRALALRPRLNPGESVMTRAGEWLGPGWVRISRGESGSDGVILREQEIGALKKRLEQLERDGEGARAAVDGGREALSELETERETRVDELGLEHHRLAEVAARIDGLRERLEDLDQRREQVEQEAQTLRESISGDEQTVRQARGRLQQSVDSMASLEQRRAQLDERRGVASERRDQTRQQAREAGARTHELALSLEVKRAALDSTRQALERAGDQIDALERRRQALKTQIEAADRPVEGEETDLKVLLDRRLEIEARLTETRQEMDRVNLELRELEQRRLALADAEQEIRAELDAKRLQAEGLRVRAESLSEQLAAADFDPETLLEGLSEDADAASWAEQLEKMSASIGRLEPVNLAAIDEHREQAERKQYLDAQNDDLRQALATLDSAIHKIDRKTRTRFKETFDRVNTGLNELFPRLFGGGHAYLELVGDELLTAGVSIMARPPGKRVTNIHLLSGGEKALTAVAFVFAIFRLNPAPFCLLDEVDAPLDDANVGRFSELVREMSERVQFLFVTHNKITMEVAHQLSGVTMREPGVSRLVSVDIAEAERMANA